MNNRYLQRTIQFVCCLSRDGRLFTIRVHRYRLSSQIGNIPSELFIGNFREIVSKEKKVKNHSEFNKNHVMFEFTKSTARNSMFSLGFED